MKPAKTAKTRKRAQPSRTHPVSARSVAPARDYSSAVRLGLLLVLTLAAYHPAWHGSPLWDDDAHLTRPAMQSLTGLWRIWFNIGATQQYYPIVHSAFWVFHRLWGGDTLGYHLVNIILHVTSAWLFVRILQRLQIPGAWLAGFVFAIHPVEVESVAWMTELKNTLSGACYLGAALAYLHFDRDRARRFYVAALAIFAVALLSKTVTATLPAALLVVFWCQRGHLRWREDVVPLVPFVALGIAGGLVTAWVERTQIGATGAAFDLTLLERTLLAGRVIWFYLAKLVWPANLIFIYPRWTIDAHALTAYLYPLGVLVALGGLWFLRGRSRAPLAVALLFIGTLVPALGFVNVYPFVFSFVADHFQYLAGLSIIAGFAAGLTQLASRWQPPPVATAAAALVLIAPLTVLTWTQSAQYADAETLYRTTIARNPDCWMAHNNLGVLMSDEAKESPQDRQRLLENAVAEFRVALRLGSHFETHSDLGSALLDLGRPQEAEPEYREALRLRPEIPEAHHGLGIVLEETGRPDQAILEIREALRERPVFAEAHDSLGNALQSLGRLDDAIAEYREALRESPNDADAHNNLGSALRHVGEPTEALAQFEEALQLNPTSAQADRNLGEVLLETGRREEALNRFRDAVRIEPESVEAHRALGRALEQAGRIEEAITEFSEILVHQPDSAEAHEDLGLALSKLARYKEAATQLAEALRLKPDPAVRANLARVLSLIKAPRS